MWDGRFGGILRVFNRRKWWFQGVRLRIILPARFRVKLSLTWKVFRPFRYALYDTRENKASIPLLPPPYEWNIQLFRFRSTSKVLKSDLARTFSFSLKNPELQLWIIKAPNNTWKRGKKGVFLRYSGPPQKGSKTRAKREHFFLAVFS